MDLIWKILSIERKKRHSNSSFYSWKSLLEQLVGIFADHLLGICVCVCVCEYLAIKRMRMSCVSVLSRLVCHISLEREKKRKSMRKFTSPRDE